MSNDRDFPESIKARIKFGLEQALMQNPIEKLAFGAMIDRIVEHVYAETYDAAAQKFGMLYLKNTDPEEIFKKLFPEKPRRQIK